MAIVAELGSLVTYKSSYVAYVKIKKDNVEVMNINVKYDPSNKKAFLDEVGKIIQKVEDSIEPIKEEVRSLLEEISKTKQSEIETKK
jgi:ABC-type hemin transport system substrate-binding protein